MLIYLVFLIFLLTLKNIKGTFWLKFKSLIYAKRVDCFNMKIVNIFYVIFHISKKLIQLNLN
jgi:hypothetical protein